MGRQLRKLLPAPPPEATTALSPSQGGRLPHERARGLHTGITNPQATAVYHRVAANGNLQETSGLSEGGPQCLLGATGVAGQVGAVGLVSNTGPAPGSSCLGIATSGGVRPAPMLSTTWVDPASLAAVMVAGVPTCVPVGMLLWTVRSLPCSSSEMGMLLPTVLFLPCLALRWGCCYGQCVSCPAWH